MKAEEFDKKFDDNKEDIIDELDFSQMRRLGYHQKSVQVNFPLWMIDALDHEANRLGVTHQSIIKIWIAEHLKHNLG